MSDDTISINTKGLDQLLKALKGKLPVVQVGVLGDKNRRTTADGVSNATVGAAHEFGTTKLPIRSFLRMPITENLRKYLEKSGFFKPDVLKQVMVAGSIKAWMEKIGVVAETVVADAFASGGFGKWKPSNMANKKNHQTLIETQQLRNSITSRVKE